jgi:hypothetical protein
MAYILLLQGGVFPYMSLTMGKFLIAAGLCAALAGLPTLAAATVSTEFFPTSPSTDLTSSITYYGQYANLPNPLAAPFAAVPFSLTATLPAQYYAPYGIGTGLYITGVSGTYSNNGVTTAYNNASVDLLDQIVAYYNSFGTEIRVDQTLLGISIPSLLATGDQFQFNMDANGFLYAENIPLVSNPLTPPPLACPNCTPVIATIPSTEFSALNGGFASYTPPLQLDPGVSIEAGGTGAVSSQLPVSAPEPGSLLLFAGAMFALLLSRRLKRLHR